MRSCHASIVSHMPAYRLREAAELLGISDDTLRRWADAERLPTGTDEAGRRVVDGADLAAFAVSLADDPGPSNSSMRNRFPGIITRVLRGDVAAQVEVQCGPHRFVSLLTAEAVDDLDLKPGDRAVATVKSTNVAVDLA
jgi:molybdopterin-binding protein